MVLAANWSTRGTSNYCWAYFHQGGRYDFASGLFEFRQRDYSPAVGRWLENDPLSFNAGDPNFYRYQGNSPTDQTDPQGLDGPGPFGIPAYPFGGPRPTVVLPPKPKPPPGSSGVGLPSPGGTVYYPPQAYNNTTNKVAIITDDTCNNDLFCWVPGDQHHPGVSSYEQVIAILSQYPDHSIDVLVISGNQGVKCNCRTRNSVNNNVYIGGPDMSQAVYDLIQQKMKKPGGQIIIASCSAGGTQANMQQTADKCKCPVTASPGTCFGQASGNYSGGGSSTKPYVTVQPSGK